MPSHKEEQWWFRELPALERQLNIDVAKRMPGYPAEQNDVVQSIIAELIEVIERRPDRFPSPWFSASAPPDETDRVALVKVARSLLRWRVADLHRREAKRYASNHVEALTDSKHLADRELLFRELIMVCVDVVSGLSDDDRNILNHASGFALGTDTRRGKLTARERKRLERIRKRLNGVVRKRFGMDVDELLR